MAYKTLDDLDLAGKRVLVRVDLNVPVENGQVTDATRIERIAPTIKDVIAKGGKPVMLAHFGRPKGQVVPEMSLKPVAAKAGEVLGMTVRFADQCTGQAASDAAQALPQGEALLLENTRFHPGEEKNDPAFAQELAAIGEIYVNDAFSAAHRAHASTEGLAKLLPACAGRSMEAELKALSAALEAPQRPVMAVVGGAKISTKLDLIGNLSKKVDMLVIGGGMANTFLAAQGHDVGKSLCEKDMIDTARKAMDQAASGSCEIILPKDVVIAREFAANAPSETVAAHACPADAMILDAGPEAIAEISQKMAAAKTLVWNGPLGAFELTPFDAATNAAALKAADLTAAGALVSVAGGGDTVAALNKSGASERFSYVSTAGGAFLEWLEGKELPGVAALKA